MLREREAFTQSKDPYRLSRPRRHELVIPTGASHSRRECEAEWRACPERSRREPAVSLFTLYI